MGQLTENIFISYLYNQMSWAWVEVPDGTTVRVAEGSVEQHSKPKHFHPFCISLIF